MPVVILTVPRRPDAEEEATLAVVAIAVSGALSLPHDAVHTVLVPAAAASTGTTRVAPWPIAVLHGQPRPADAMAAAAEALRALLADRYGVPATEVWVQWAT